MFFKNLTLEMSLKPFPDFQDSSIRAATTKIITQWQSVIRHAGQVSIMLWTADGSELLDYDRDMNRPVEWARYIGGANARKPIPGDPQGIALHSRSYLYKDNPPILTYRKLSRIVAILKEQAGKLTGKPIRVGTTFDPGPEFAESQFKYHRHPEICLAKTMGQGFCGFVTCYATLNADSRPYAAYPHGIPQDTPFGTFFGKQCQCFLDELGFDYIWFSNGFGFGSETWQSAGVLFNGEVFNPEKAVEYRERAISFWKAFRQNCPDHCVEVRGTNLTTAVDLSTDAAPIKALYTGRFNIATPPNSPWAAMNGDFGLELAGYMSRIAELPDGADGFPFRFYTHDPWWLNSPWLDRYGREPHDIYMPLAVGRIDENGKTRHASALEFLTIDDSYGDTPDQVPDEVAPHIAAAGRHFPDQPGPLVWIYPFDEYDEMTFGDNPRLDKVFFGDWLIRGAINTGLPLNTVVSSRIFNSTVKHFPDLYKGSVLLSIVPQAGSQLADNLIQHVQQGGKALLYGPIDDADPAMLKMLNLKTASAISGQMAISLARDYDTILNGTMPNKTIHRPLMCSGACQAVLAEPNDAATSIIAQVHADSKTRIAAMVRAQDDWCTGQIAWVRGINSIQSRPAMHLPTSDDLSEFFAAELLMRYAFCELGYEIYAVKHNPADRENMLTIARNGNGFFFSGYSPDTTVDLQLRLPLGAPLLTGTDTILKDGRANYRMERAWHRECRVFIDHQKTGKVSCNIQASIQMGITGRLAISGLQNATLCFFPIPGHEKKTSMLGDPVGPFLQGNWLKPELVTDEYGIYLSAKGITGDVLISW